MPQNHHQRVERSVSPLKVPDVDIPALHHGNDGMIYTRTHVNSLHSADPQKLPALENRGLTRLKQQLHVTVAIGGRPGYTGTERTGLGVTWCDSDP